MIDKSVRPYATSWGQHKAFVLMFLSIILLSFHGTAI